MKNEPARTAPGSRRPPSPEELGRWQGALVARRASRQLQIQTHAPGIEARIADIRDWFRRLCQLAPGPIGRIPSAVEMVTA